MGSTDQSIDRSIDRQEHALSKCLPFVEHLKHQHCRARCMHATTAHKIIIMVAINRKRTRGCISTRAGRAAKAPADLRAYVRSPKGNSSLYFLSLLDGACSPMEAHPGWREGRRRTRRRTLRTRATALYCAISACPRALWCCSDLRRAVFRWRDSKRHRAHFLEKEYVPRKI